MNKEKQTKRFAMACAIVKINFESLDYALCGLSEDIREKVQDNILHDAREILRQQPGDPLTPRATPRPRRVEVGRHVIKALIWRSRISGKPGRIKILKG